MIDKKKRSVVKELKKLDYRLTAHKGKYVTEFINPKEGIIIEINLLKKTYNIISTEGKKVDVGTDLADLLLRAILIGEELE